MNPMFKKIQSLGAIDDHEMYKTFNCGIGMMIILNRKDYVKLQRLYDVHNITYNLIGRVINKSTALDEITFV
jgi:phosphoribosylaminoimidazole (AIR) synthetase